MARARLALGGARQRLQDAALACRLMRVAGIAQGVELLLKRTQGLDLLVDARDLLLDQLVDPVAGQFRARLKTPQDADFRQADAERAAMPDEVELNEV